MRNREKDLEENYDENDQFYETNEICLEYSLFDLRDKRPLNVNNCA